VEKTRRIWRSSWQTVFDSGASSDAVNGIFDGIEAQMSTDLAA
jgi:hypothetical protein